VLKTRLFSSAFVFTFFAIICSIGLAPINDASANEGTAITKVESKEHDTLHGLFNSLVQVDSDTYALAYSGNNGDGYISTFDISSSGAITAVASLEHDTVQGEHNSLVQVDSDTYALAYAGSGLKGYISTFDISSSGAITAVKTQSLGNNLEHDTVQGSYNSLVQVDSDTYALAYAGSGLDGYISTFDISSSGAITAVKTQSLGNNLEHDTVQGEFNSLVQVDSDTYALAYSGSGADGYISTFTISADGSTTLVEVESEEHDLAMGRSNSLVQVDSDTYALAYTGDANDGYISTFDINSAGNITPIKVQNHAVIGGTANLEHDISNGENNSLVQVDSDTYALAYEGDADDGYISTFTISADGSTITEIISLEHDTSNVTYNSLVQVDSDTYALAYAGDSTDGFISTFTIDTFVAAAVEENKKSSGCYDCIPPTLLDAQIIISTNEQIIMPSKDGNYNTDETLHITANIGDKVTILLNVTDNKSVDDFRFAGLYTNYQEKPSNMKTFYANNYDNLRQVSTSFYLWDSRADDIAYDYDGTVSWSDNSPEIVTSEINEDNFKFKNDENNVQYFMMPFTFTINEHMDSTQVVAKVYDGAYNRLHVTLPVVLEVAGNDPLNFENLGKQKVLGFFDEAVLIQSISDWDDSQDNTEKLAQLLGVSEDSIPLWTVNLAKWVSEDKIDSANLIVAVEYLLNQ